MILVIAEQKDGQVNRASWEAIVAAQKTAEPVIVVVAGQGSAAAAADLAAAQVAEVVAIDGPALAQYTADGFTAAYAQVVAERQPTHVFIAHTYQTRDFAPKLAARLDRSILTDCTAVKAGTPLTFVRPMFQAKLAADVAIEGPGPHFVTFQIGSFKVDELVRGGAAAPVVAVSAAVDVVRQQPDAPFREARQAVDLTQAERIVSVGRGIKAPENIPLAKELADALQAELAASRPICDAGWLPMERQVGSSGQTVAPKLYLALGISGAIQHVVGMKGAKTIVAINKDAEAPIFELADYGIAGDIFEVVPQVIAALKA